MTTKGSLLTIGGWGESYEKKPLSDITNIIPVPETPRALNPVLDEEDISLEEVPTAPLKVEFKVSKSAKPGTGKRLQFEDENSLQNITQSATVQSTAPKHLMAKEKTEEDALAPPPMMKRTERNRKRYNISGNRDSEKELKTPQKKTIPLLYGANVTVDSPDPMSKFNVANTSNVSSMGKLSTTLSKILKDYDMPPPNPSPGSIVDDIYDFDKPTTSVIAAKSSSLHSKWKGESISDVLRNSSEALPKNETTRDSSQLHPPRKSISDEDGTMFEKTFEENISMMRRHKSRAERMDPLSQNCPPTSRGGSRMVRTGAGKILQPPIMRSLDQLPTSSLQNSASSSSLCSTDIANAPSKQSRESTPVRKQLPTSRSLDTLTSPMLAHIDEEDASVVTHSPIVPQRPTPPPSNGQRGAAPGRKNMRLTPTPPPTMSPPSSDGNTFGFDTVPSPVENNSGFSRSRGRTYKPSTLNNDIETCALDEKEPEASHSTFVQIGFEVGSHIDEISCENSCDILVETIKTFQKKFIGSKPKRKGHTATCVSGCSRVLMQRLLSKASNRRRKKSKYPVFFSPRFESIPEHEHIELCIPRWIKLCTTSLYRSVSLSSTLNPLERTTQITREVSDVMESDRHIDLKKKSVRLQHDSAEAKAAMDPEYVEWLLSQGGIDDDNRTSAELRDFFSAIRSNDGSQFKEMLANNCNLIYGRDGNGNTALILSTIVGWRKGIKLLIKKGADVNAQNRFGNTCLHFAYAMDASDDIQKYFVKKNASTQIRNERGLCCIANSSETISYSHVAMI